MPRDAFGEFATAALLAALSLGLLVACPNVDSVEHGGGGATGGDSSVGGSSVGTGGSWPSSGGSDAGPGGGGTSSGGSGGTTSSCGNSQCESGETCSSCPGDCPSGGTKDCYANGLHSNCCSGQNSTVTECQACNNDLGCPQAEYDAYCDRFSAGDNLWQQYHRNWVESQCGGSAQNDGNQWYCTNASTCTTYTCAI